MAASRSTERFDAAAVAYDTYRPCYPDAIFDDILTFGGLRPGDQAVEVGAGTGIATEPLVDRGLAVTAIEPGPNMAEIAAERIGDRGQVIVTRFEDWISTLEDVRLVAAFNAWHWIEPSTAMARASSLLRPGGVLALAWTEIVSWGQPPFEERLMELTGSLWPTGIEHVEASLQPVRNDPRFSDIQVRRHRFSRALDAETYIAVARTYGDGLNPEVADILRRIIDRDCSGSVTKVEDATVYLARFTGV